MATGSFRNAVDSYNMKHFGTTSPGMLPDYDAIVKGYWDSKTSSTTSTAGDHTADALTYEKLAEAIQKVTGVEPPKKAPANPEFGSW